MALTAPRNNLQDVLRRNPSAQQQQPLLQESPHAIPERSTTKAKFRPAKSRPSDDQKSHINLDTSTPLLPTTSWAGKPPTPTALRTPSTPRQSRASIIDVSSPEQLATVNPNIPAKRLSPDYHIVPNTSTTTKRQRTANGPNEESALRKGEPSTVASKDSLVSDLTSVDDDCPPCRSIDHIRSTSGTPGQGEQIAASHRTITNVTTLATRLQSPPSNGNFSNSLSNSSPSSMSHADLENKSMQTLEALYNHNLELRMNNTTAITNYYAHRGENADIAILETINRIVSDRLNAIRARQNTLQGMNHVAERSTPTLSIASSSTISSAIPFIAESNAGVAFESRVLPTANLTNSSSSSSGVSLLHMPKPDADLANDNTYEILELSSDDEAEISAALDNMDDFQPPVTNASTGTAVAAVASSSYVGPRIDHTATPYYREIMEKLKKVFKLQEFRANQLAAISSTLAGKDVFVLMPTGGGKSLCYQLPAICQTGETKGITFVVSPLIALINDQGRALQEKGIDVVLFTSDQMKDEGSKARSRLLDPWHKPSVVYVTPERLAQNQDMQNILRRLYEAGEIARFVIDEAHCISTWGRGFRDSYVSLDRLRQEYPKVPIMALTATANDVVKNDIVHRLGIQGCVMLTSSFNRPNLFYDVRPKTKQVVADIAAFIKSSHPSETGIIYCLSRAKCEEVAQELRSAYSLKAKHFHAGMTAADREHVQREWQRGDFRIVVATIAFGMGIDKANVRFVIHHQIPKSFEGYYQETGRAGRDQGPADCIMFYSYGDMRGLYSLIDNSENVTPEEKKRQKEAVREVVSYCQNMSECRRLQVLRYFGQSFDPKDCHKGCDVCFKGETFIAHDVSAAARDAVLLMQQLEHKGNITRAMCENVFKGAQTNDIKTKGFNLVQGHGAGKSLPRGWVDHLFNALVNMDAFEIYQVTNRSKWSNQYMKLGSEAQGVLSGKKKVTISVPASGGNENQAGTGRTRQRLTNKPSSTREKSGKGKGKARDSGSEHNEPIEPFEDDVYATIEADEEDAIEESDNLDRVTNVAKPLWPPIRKSTTRPASNGAAAHPNYPKLAPPEPSTESEDLKNTRLYRALTALTGELATKEGVEDSEDILYDSVLQMFVHIPPLNGLESIRAILREEYEDEAEVQEKAKKYGSAILRVVSSEVASSTTNGGSTRVRSFKPARG